MKFSTTQRNPDASRLMPAEITSLPARSLKGVEVIDTEGRILGSIADVVLGAGGEVQAIVLETPVAFGLSARREQRPIDRIDLLVDPYDRYFLRLTADAQTIPA